MLGSFQANLGRKKRGLNIFNHERKWVLLGEKGSQARYVRKKKGVDRQAIEYEGQFPQT